MLSLLLLVRGGPLPKPQETGRRGPAVPPRRPLRLCTSGSCCYPNRSVLTGQTGDRLCGLALYGPGRAERRDGCAARARCDRKDVDAGTVLGEAYAQKHRTVDGRATARGPDDVVDLVGCDTAALQEAAHAASVDLACVHLELLDADGAGGCGIGIDADHAGGHVVTHDVRFAGDAVDQLRGRCLGTQFVDDLLQPPAPDHRAAAPGLEEPVGEQADRAAGRKRDRRLTEAGRCADTERRRRGNRERLMGSGPGDDRRRVPGARVGERARRRIVYSGDDGRELLAIVLVDDVASQLERGPRAEAGLEVGPDHMAREGGRPKRLATVPGDVAAEEADAVVVEGEDVIEVATGGESLSGTVGDGHSQRTHVLRDNREERGLERADVGE